MVAAPSTEPDRMEKALPDTKPPQFNPSYLVTLTMELLNDRYHIPSTIASSDVSKAVDAATELLLALGVKPTTQSLHGDNL